MLRVKCRAPIRIVGSYLRAYICRCAPVLPLGCQFVRVALQGFIDDGPRSLSAKRATHVLVTKNILVLGIPGIRYVRDVIPQGFRDIRLEVLGELLAFHSMTVHTLTLGEVVFCFFHTETIAEAQQLLVGELEHGAVHLGKVLRCTLLSFHCWGFLTLGCLKLVHSRHNLIGCGVFSKFCTSLLEESCSLLFLRRTRSNPTLPTGHLGSCTTYLCSNVFRYSWRDTQSLSSFSVLGYFSTH